MTLLLAFGTRPEAIKMGPIAAALTEAEIPWQGLCTGQHTALLRGTPADTDLSRSQSLDLPSDGQVLRWLATAERLVRSWLLTQDIDIVVVQGDTMSALAVARAADGRLLCHVEAGLRSGDSQNPWPEEDTRIEITRLADWHYAPTSKACANLMAEGVPVGKIRTTGNPIVSALARYTTARPSPSLGHVLITLHRREWVTGSQFQESLATLLQEIALHPHVEFFWPVHPAVWLAGETAFQHLPKNLFVIAPMPYDTSTRMLATAVGTLTDSGGIQEEAATLGVPCAVMRTISDRPESLEVGSAQLFPPTPQGFGNGIRCLVSNALPRIPSDCYGHPNSASLIAHHLATLAMASQKIPVRSTLNLG